MLVHGSSFLRVHISPLLASAIFVGTGTMRWGAVVAGVLAGLVYVALQRDAAVQPPQFVEVTKDVFK